MLTLDRSLSRVLFHYPVVAAFETLVERCRGELEQGGILLGRYRGPHLEVTSLTYPGPEDRRSLYSFTRQDPLHETLAREAWSSSNETLTGVGEWHTHPFGPPVPSTTDNRAWRKFSKAAKAVTAFVVVAPAGWSAHLLQNHWQARIGTLEKEQDGVEGQVFVRVGKRV